MTVRYDSPVVPATTRAHHRRTPVEYVWAIARISLGWVFLWAFLDKTFGLGRATESGQGWVDGASPTEGFLTFAPAGPFEGMYHDMAGNALVDWLFMLALLGIGVALILGIGMRAAAVSATALLVMMWTVVLPPENNPFMDDHLVYAMLAIGLAMVQAGNTLGLGARWQQTDLVRRHPWLT